MGQAWCKERTKKAQDSKSPLDRVFVRCAHQIYPTLKQDGSVLGGGATQRVTSSEIGYAGSPPREALTRGQSVDSIDRPFHPSEWVDVNLEVPSTPSSVITNLTANTSIYPTTTLSSTGSNLKSATTPIPPPRKRRKNRGRPLPPKPDEPVVQTHIKNGKTNKKSSIEPLYSSVKLSNKNSNRNLEFNKNFKEGDDRSNADNLKEVMSDERNARIASGNGDDGSSLRDVKEEIRKSRNDDGDDEENDEEGRDSSHNVNNNNNNNKEETLGDNKNREEGYQNFSKGDGIATISASTPKTRLFPGRESALRELAVDTITSHGDRPDEINPTSKRPKKNFSTISLPNYDELEVVKKEVGDAAQRLDAPAKPGRARHASTISLPGRQPASRVPRGLTERLEQYMTRSRSFGSLTPGQVIDELKAQGETIESSDEDDWGGLDDWDLGVIEYQDSGDGRSPLEPSSKLWGEKETEKGEKKSANQITDKKDPAEKKNQDKLSIPRNSSFEVPKSPNSLKSALKLEANRKFSVPAKLSSNNSGNPLDEWFSAQERSVRFFDAPKLEDEFANAPGHRPAKPSPEEKKYDTRRYPFNGSIAGPLDIETFFESAEDFGGTKGSGEFDNRPRSLNLSLSNESEPFENYEEKELTQGSSLIKKLSRTISDESLPDEMSSSFCREDSFIGDKKGSDLSKNVINSSLVDSKTPPPSPEPKIRANILDNDSKIGLRTGRGGSKKISNDEETGSNFSSMTPSLNELEAALSDMLEKEEKETEKELVDDSKGTNLIHEGDDDDDDAAKIVDDRPIEPKIFSKVNDGGEIVSARRRKGGETNISLGEIFRYKDNTKVIGGGKKAAGKNPFEDSDEEEESKGDKKSVGNSDSGFDNNRSKNPFDTEPPEKPSRLIQRNEIVENLEEDEAEDRRTPTPPQRKNKHGTVSPISKKISNDFDRESEFPIEGNSSVPHPNDRLI